MLMEFGLVRNSFSSRLPVLHTMRVVFQNNAPVVLKGKLLRVMSPVYNCSTAELFQ